MPDLVNGYCATCANCLYFNFEEQPKSSSSYGFPPDGFCSKVFPAGYSKKNKERHYVKSSRDAACFQFELLELGGDFFAE